MRIGEFTTLVNSTKDTVRHYEDLNLITPIRHNKAKIYGQKDVIDFQVIMELKEYGLALREIQFIFELKKSFACGDKELITQVFNQLTEHLKALKQEEEEIRNRRIKLEEEVSEFKKLLK